MLRLQVLGLSIFVIRRKTEGERRRGKIELDFGLLVTFQNIRLDNLKKSSKYVVWFESQLQLCVYVWTNADACLQIGRASANVMSPNPSMYK